MYGAGHRSANTYYVPVKLCLHDEDRKGNIFAMQLQVYLSTFLQFNTIILLETLPVTL